MVPPLAARPSMPFETSDTLLRIIGSHPIREPSHHLLYQSAYDIEAFEQHEAPKLQEYPLTGLTSFRAIGEEHL